MLKLANYLDGGLDGSHSPHIAQSSVHIFHDVIPQIVFYKIVAEFPWNDKSGLEISGNFHFHGNFRKLSIKMTWETVLLKQTFYNFTMSIYRAESSDGALESRWRVELKSDI